MRWKTAFLISAAVHCAAIPLAFRYAVDAPALGKGEVQLSLELSEERVEKPIAPASLPVSPPEIIPETEIPAMESKETTQPVEKIIEEIKVALVAPSPTKTPAKVYSEVASPEPKIEAPKHFEISKDSLSSALVSPVEVNAAPRYRENREPAYPSLARRKKQEGTVILVVTVNTNGAPMKIEVKQGTGFSLLDEAAVQAVGHWQFEPAKIDKRPIISSVEIPISFKLSK